MEKFRVGVIGLGAFGESHLHAYRGLPGVDVVAVASRSAGRSEEVASTFGVDRAYANYADLCNDPDVQAVSICTEETMHVEPTLMALAAGKHVLLEKPMASNLADAITIRDAAAQSSAVLMPAHIVRFEPRFASLRDATLSGSTGRITAMHATRNRPRQMRATYERCHPALVTAIHDLDIMLWVSRELPTRVRAVHLLEPKESGRYGIWAMLFFPSGAIATIEATWMLPNDSGLVNGDTFSVLGTRGYGQIDLGNGGLRWIEDNSVTIPEYGYEAMVHGVMTGALLRELVHFVRIATNRDVEPVVTPDDGVRAVLLAEALIESATRDAEIPIDWPDDLHFA